jgi:hypothetical protein
MDAEKMTPAELRKLADTKEQKGDEFVKEGFLKHDLYEYNENSNINLSIYDFWLFTKEDMDELLAIPRFEKVLSKGTRFICFIDNDEENWYDNIEYGIESMSSEWAEEHLENIKDL